MTGKDGYHFVELVGNVVTAVAPHGDVFPLELFCQEMDLYQENSQTN